MFYLPLNLPYVLLMPQISVRVRACYSWKVVDQRNIGVPHL